jgi:hypothetical protein
MSDGPDGFGGGSYVSGGTLTLTRCEYVNNSGGPVAYYARGFGMYAINATIQMTDCVFSNNTYFGSSQPNRGSRGGGFYVHGGSLTATNCTFANNRVPSQSGSSDPRSGGGGGTLTHGVVAEFTDCTFSDNRVVREASNNPEMGGGALRLYDDGSGTSVSLNNCAITHSRSGEHGGAIHVASGSLSLQNCVVGNSSLDFASKHGAAFYITGGSVSLTNCTVAGNSSLDEGGGFYLGGGSLEMKNCILWTNTAPTRGADISNIGGTSVKVNYSNMSGDTNDNAYVYDATNTVSGANIHWVDPLFASATDFHLQSEAGRWDPGSMSFVFDAESSPVLDAGDPDDDVGDETAPHGNLINLGAYGGTAEASKSTTGFSGSVLEFR